MFWENSFIADTNTVKPDWVADRKQDEDMAKVNKSEQIKRVFDQVEWQDAHRDHSLEALTPDEQMEITLFHSFKQDPYYKHHMRSYLARYAEDMDQTILAVESGDHEVDPNDHVKFDRVSLFDFRRTLPQKEREPKLDNKGRAWGSGKRKNALAVANVYAGSGKVTVNGRPLLQYFLLPSQRQRILLPLIVTHYTCLVDITINVRGGGTTGQCEACVPAIAKALQAYDVNTRPMLKYLRLLRNDSRRVERKKPGLLKARKGQTYVRR